MATTHGKGARHRGMRKRLKLTLGPARPGLVFYEWPFGGRNGWAIAYKAASTLSRGICCGFEPRRTKADLGIECPLNLKRFTRIWADADFNRFDIRVTVHFYCVQIRPVFWKGLERLKLVTVPVKQ